MGLGQINSKMQKKSESPKTLREKITHVTKNIFHCSYALINFNHLRSPSLFIAIGPEQWELYKRISLYPLIFLIFKIQSDVHQRLHGRAMQSKEATLEPPDLTEVSKNFAMLILPEVGLIRH